MRPTNQTDRGRVGAQKRRASVLVGLLWCLALLSMVVVGVLRIASTDVRVGKNYADKIQAHYLALAGIEKAKALLFHEARERKGSHVNHSGKLYDAPDEFQDVKYGRGQFRILRLGEDGRGVVYGISDEESRLNVNVANAEQLQKLPGMTPETAASIIDYRDGDNTATQGGAEEDAYAAMQPPYRPRNAPFPTMRELFMVRGLSRQLFLEEDANQNGLMDPQENDGDVSWPPDNKDGVLDAGWSAWMTVNSEGRLENAKGEAQINIQDGSEEDLANVPGFSADLAKAIVAFRGQRQLESLADLLDVTAPAPPNQPRPPPPSSQPSSPQGRSTRGGAPPSARPQSAQPGQPQPSRPSGGPGQGPPLINQQLLMEVADSLTAHDGTSQRGAVNINTASVEVLACLPGLDRQLAQAIVSHRSSSGFFPSIAHLLQVPNVTREVFKQVAPLVTVRSTTFRILSEGEVPSSKARQRIEVRIRLGSSFVDTLSYREDDL